MTLLLAAIAGGVVAVVLIGGRAAKPAATAPARVAQAPAAIGAADITPHLDALAAAARETGTRAAGTPGDAATRAHVVDALRAAGWRVTVQGVRFPYFDERRAPRVTLAGGRRLAAGREARTLAYSAGGRATGAVRAIAGASDAGCRARDFADLRDGEVALVRRGTCRMSVKAHNAQAAGASAVLIVNDGRPGNRGAIAGTLGAPGLRIPAVFLSSAAGRDVRAARRVTVDVDAVSEERRTANVLAETGRGSQVAMAGAHLDSVTDGPGINDDGSGSPRCWRRRARCAAGRPTARGCGSGSGAPRSSGCTARAGTSPGSGRPHARRSPATSTSTWSARATATSPCTAATAASGVASAARSRNAGSATSRARTSARAPTTRPSRGPGSRSAGSSPAWTAATTARATTPATWTRIAQPMPRQPPRRRCWTLTSP